MSRLVYHATLDADPTTGHATIAVVGSDLATQAAGSRVWYDVLLTLADATLSPLLVVYSSLWNVSTAASSSSATLSCTAQDGTEPADGSEARFARRQDITWPAGATGTISLVAKHADGTVYNLTGCGLTLTIRLPASTGAYDASILPAQGALQTTMDDLTHALLTYQPNLKVLGPNDAAGEVRPPFIAWRPTQGRFEVGGNRTGGKPNEPGLLWIRCLDVAFEIFGGDIGVPDYGLTPTEGLLELLVNCLQQRFTMPSYRATSERWLQMGRTGRGLSCELTATIRLPLVRLDNSTVTVTAFDPTIAITQVVPNV
ncbi:MAG TPA: hypothetical protein VJ801_16350 [Polyangia bacterium]|jgi:hypothetical protein|nr:hypothetical protein [Polyangia bacterium]